ncbi:hypothetical protein SAMN05216522_102129 [Rosenbergiella nectarea]|uniref:Uncharacterized protein n=1 Tax=Rosenbergiella nectarea TaxID=988801 RepID=A0A1H9F169_9GAMM|nr:hypothetical protein [Rosenbergiella nectarea]SEQ31706.1 hypothetical protein SAMN05216522_102129 [Rosenbergiella nectarea]
MGWVGVDLDGTLAEYPPQNGGVIGDAIPDMVERVLKWHAEGVELRIFTVRATSNTGIKQVKAWLKANSLPELAVTAVKDSGLIELWDDRAVRVIRNTGAVCPGCANQSHLSALHWKVTNC